MNKQELKKYKKITIVFSDSQKLEFFVKDLDQDELTEIVTRFYNGALMIRNFYGNPRNVNYFTIDNVDDLEESEEEKRNGRLD